VSVSKALTHSPNDVMCMHTDTGRNLSFRNPPKCPNVQLERLVLLKSAVKSILASCEKLVRVEHNICKLCLSLSVNEEKLPSVA